jgi:hypothetical protein
MPYQVQWMTSKMTGSDTTSIRGRKSLSLELPYLSAERE